MDSRTPTPTAEERAVFALAVMSTAAPTTVKWAESRLYQLPKMGSICPSRGAKGDTNRGEMGSITPTPTAEERAVLTLAVVLKAASKQ